MPSSVSATAAQIRTLLGRAGQVLRGQSDQQGLDTQRWLVVTIDAPSEDIAPGGALPAPLAELGDTVEVELRPAPGDRGTELAARFRPGPTPSGATASHPDEEQDAAEQRVTAEHRQQLRQALRQVKQLVEVGEVLVAEPRPEGFRPKTISGMLVDRAERRADQGGVL
jgi:hypothetical protein